MFVLNELFFSISMCPTTRGWLQTLSNSQQKFNGIALWLALNFSKIHLAWILCPCFETFSGFVVATRRNDRMRHGLKRVECASPAFHVEIVQFPLEKFTIQTGFAHAQLLTCFDCFWRLVHAKTMVFRSQTIISATTQTWTKLFICLLYTSDAADE